MKRNYLGMKELSLKCSLENLKPYDDKSSGGEKRFSNNKKLSKKILEFVTYWNNITKFEVEILSINYKNFSYGIDMNIQYNELFVNNILTQNIVYLYNIKPVTLRETLVHHKLVCFLNEEQENLFKSLLNIKLTINLDRN
jgi:hypothetical protein